MRSTSKSGTTRATTSAAPNDVLAMIARHEELYQQTDRLYEHGGDDATDGAEYRAAIAEAIDLEYLIPLTTPRSSRGLAAKRRFMKARADEMDGLDLATLLETILKLDAARIASR